MFFLRISRVRRDREKKNKKKNNGSVAFYPLRAYVYNKYLLQVPTLVFSSTSGRKSIRHR